jgi:hypothetical protein
MKEATDDCQTQTKAKAEDTASALIVCGLTAGALGTGVALVTGAVCSLCLVATPALLGGGVLMKLKEKYKKDKL